MAGHTDNEILIDAPIGFVWRVPNDEGTVYTWVSERRLDPDTYTAEARRIETGPFEYMNLRWTYDTVDGCTRMRWVQDFDVKPQAPMDNAGAEDYLNRNTAVQMK